MELLMSKPKNIKKPNYRKISEKIKKLGNPNEATNSQLERLFNLQHIKYVMSLEDQLKEDKAHLLLKQNTIETLEEDITKKGELMALWVKSQKRNVKIVNRQRRVEEDDHKKLFAKLVEFRDANTELAEHNKKITQDNFDLTRAYNGLHTLGKFAEESGVDIKKHNGKLPENDKYEFHQKHTLLESGKVKHQYKLKAKKKGQND